MISFIINPISGGVRPEAARARAELASSIVDRHGNPLTMKLNGPVEPYFRDADA